MKKKVSLLFLIAVLALCFSGVFAACTAKDIDVPKPEIVGGDENNCDHEYEVSEEVDATCQVRAHTVYVCTLCGDTYTVYSGELAPHTLATRHKNGDCRSYGYTEHYCTVCRNVIATENDTYLGEHKFSSVNRHVNGDCRTLGYTIVKECSVCKQQELRYDDVYGEHKYGKAVHTEATCVTPDFYTSTCTLCGNVHIEYGTDIRDHDLTETVVPGSDCKHLTTIVRTCKNCDYTESEQTAVYGPHVYSNTGDGEKHTCAVCGDKKDHTEVVRDVSDEGHVSFCSVCGYVFQERSGTHLFGDAVVVQPTCTENGSVTRSCSLCDHSYSYILPARHVYSAAGGERVSNTCTEDGYYRYTCVSCGKVTTEKSTSAPNASSIGVSPSILLNETVSNDCSFGTYPQTRVDDPLLLYKLNAGLPALPTAASKKSWNVYSYSQNDPYAWYTDVEDNGQKYRAVYFTSYRPVSSDRVPAQSSSLTDDNGFTAGVVYWFRFDPILWKVLSSDATHSVLSSCVVLDAAPLGVDFTAWEGSYLYSFLYDEFYAVAFTPAEKEKIEDGGVLLPSTNDYENLSEYDRRKVTSDYALSQGVYSLSFSIGSTAKNYSPWWLMPSGTKNAYDIASFGGERDLAPGHTFVIDEMTTDNLRSAPTCVDFATYYKYCSVCGALSDEYVENPSDGLALHTYAYSYTDEIHTYGCSVCGETLLQEQHTLVFTDSANGLTHLAECSVCHYSHVENHNFSSNRCSRCNAEKLYADVYWDVSANGDNSLVAYLNGNDLTIRGKGYMKNYTSSDHPPYYDRRDTVKTVTLSSSMYNIGAFAFGNFSALTDVTVPATVQSIGNYAFAYTSSLKQVRFLSKSCGDFSADNNVFCKAGDRMSVVIGPDVERIPSYFLYPSANNLPSVSSVSGGDKVTSIGACAFRDLSTTVFDAFSAPQATKIGDSAFRGDRALSFFTLGDKLSSVGNYAFYDCISTIFVGDPTCSFVGEYAFYGCAGLTSLRLTSMTTVPSHAFYNAGLRNVALPNSLVSVEEYAFYGCGDLVLSELPPSLADVKKYAFYQTNASPVLNADGLKTVGEYAFYGCDGLTSFSASALTSIGRFAFAFCKDMTSFEGEKITSIPEGAFAECTALRFVTYSENLSSFGKEAFLNCRKLHYVFLPENLTTIGTNAFSGCLTLAEIKNLSSLTLRMGSTANGCVALNAKRIFNELSPAYRITDEGLIVLPVDSTEYVIDYIGNDRSLVVSGYDVIVPYAFYGLTDLEEVTVAESKIERYAFSDCGRLTSVTLGPQIASIAPTAFSNDRILKLTINGADLQTRFDAAENKEYLTGATVLSLFYGETDVTPVPTPAEDPNVLAEGDLTATLTYRYETDKTLYISGAGSVPQITDGILTSAEKIVLSDGITAIGDNAFLGFGALSEITVPNGLISVGERAFYRCSALQAISLPASLETIGAYAFADCYGIERIDYACVSANDLVRDNYVFYNCGRNTNGMTLVISDDCEKIPAYMFDPVYSLSAVSPNIVTLTVGANVTSIGDNAFRNLSSVTELSLPATITTIGTTPLAGMTKLTALTVPSLSGVFGTWFGANNSSVPGTLKEVTVLTCSAIPNGAFGNIPSLESVTLPEGVTRIGDNAFSSCVLLSGFSVTSGSAETPFTSLTYVGKEAFFGCSSLESVSLHFIDGNSGMGDNVFTQCEKLERVTLNGPSVVGKDVFRRCDELAELTFSGEQFYVHDHVDGTESAFGVYFLDEMADSYSLVSYAGKASSYVVPDTLNGKPVSAVSAEAFSTRTLLRRVTIGKNVTALGNKAFFGCGALTEVSFANDAQLRTLGQEAFSDCSSLTNIVLPTSLTAVGAGAFRNCTALTTFTLPGNVSSIGTGAFESCRKLTSFTFASPNTSPLRNLPEKMFYSCVLLTSVSLPKNVERINASAFEQCSSLSSVVLPNNLKTLNDNAFSHCKSLTTLSLPGTLSVIGQNVFNGCHGLKEIVLGAQINSLSLGVFNGCGGLESLTIPFVNASAVQLDGSTVVYPFGYFFGTTPFNDSVRIEQYDTKRVVRGSRVTVTYERNYYYIPASLKKVTVLGSELTYGSFMNCSSLEEINVAGIVSATLTQNAFYGCTSLRSVVFPSNLHTIETNAFYGCVSLTFVKEDGSDMLLPESVADVDKSAFYSTGLSNRSANWEDGVLYVKVANGATADGYVYYAINSSATTKKACRIKDGTLRIVKNALANSTFTELYIPSSVRYIDQGILQGNTTITLLSAPFIGRMENDTATAYLAYFFGVSLPETGAANPKFTANSATQSAEQKEFIPSSLTTLILNGSGTLYPYVCSGCHTLKTVILAGAYTTIATSAFSGCYLLENVSLPTGLETIDQYAFENCGALPEIVIPNHTSYIGIGAFAGCVSLGVFSAPFIGNRVNANQYLGYLFYPSTDTGNPSVQESGKLVPDSLTTVIISGTETAIPLGAFYGCKNLTTIIFDCHVTTIGKEAFAGCTSLQYVYITGTGNFSAASLRYNDGDNVSDHETFTAALTRTGYRIFFPMTEATASVRPLADYLADPSYSNPYRSFLSAQPYFTNSLSFTAPEDMTSVQYSSSDEEVATFLFSYEWDENKNGSIENSETFKLDNSSDGEMILLSAGTTTITLTFRIKHSIGNNTYIYIPITLSYTLTVENN